MKYTEHANDHDDIIRWQIQFERSLIHFTRELQFNFKFSSFESSLIDIEVLTDKMEESSRIMYGE